MTMLSLSKARAQEKPRHPQFGSRMRWLAKSGEAPTMVDRKKSISVRRSKPDGRMARVLGAYEVRHDGVILAKLQEHADGGLWFWYGMSGPKYNSVKNLRPFDVVKAEAVHHCRAFLAEMMNADSEPLMGNAWTEKAPLPVGVNDTPEIRERVQQALSLSVKDRPASHSNTTGEVK